MTQRMEKIVRRLMVKSLRVNEIFRSLQGEGLLVGTPTTFVRLQGCNLNCKYCDTKYASKSLEGSDMSIENIVSKVEELLTPRGSWICLTGGEPLFQPNVQYLIQELASQDLKISVETNGSYPPPYWWEYVESWVPDIKCPSSGEENRSLPKWLNLRKRDQVKFVVSTLKDLLFVDSVLSENPKYTSTVLISPCIDFSLSGSITQKSQEWLPIVADFCKSRDLRFSLQIHKFIWGQRRGV